MCHAETVFPRIMQFGAVQYMAWCGTGICIVRCGIVLTELGHTTSVQDVVEA